MLPLEAMVINLVFNGPINWSDSLAVPAPPARILNLAWALPLLGRKVIEAEAVVEVDLMARSDEVEATVNSEVALGEVVPTLTRPVLK